MIHIVRSDGETFETDSLNYREAVRIIRDPDGIFEIVGRPTRATAIGPFPVAFRADKVIAVEDWS
jgi:hypothetical protein